MRQQLFVAAAFLSAVCSGQAADYPSHQITFVVPFAAGGPLDSIARIFAPRMSSLLGEPIVDDAPPGGLPPAVIGEPSGQAENASQLRQLPARQGARRAGAPSAERGLWRFARSAIDSLVHS